MQPHNRSVDFRIGPPQVLLLKAALSSDKNAAAAALEDWWKDIADFDDVRGTDAALFPRVYWNLNSLIRDPRLGLRLKGAARHHWLKNQYLISSCGQLLDRLNQAGIPALLMKGAAIAATVDDDPGLRAMSDCDLLVPKTRALEVVDILVRSGLLEEARIGERDLDVVHGVTLRLRRSQHAIFDIHWRPLRAIGAEEFAAEMFGAAKSVHFAGQACLAPCPEHLVFHAIVHGVDWSPHPRYDWLVDTAKILRHAGSAFDWRKLVDVARRYRYSFLVRSALTEAHDKTGINVPDWVGRQLGSSLAVLERREVHIRLSKPSMHSVSDEMLLALQQIRRRSVRNLRRPAVTAVPTLFKSLFGTPSGDRSFIHNDRKERISFLQGWSAPEVGGRWTEGHCVSLAIYAPEQPKPTLLAIRAIPLLLGVANGGQTIDVAAGYRRLGTMRWPKWGRGLYAQAVRLPSTIWRGDTAVLRLQVRRPIAPIEADLNGDTRALGIFVDTLMVDPPVRDAVRSPLDLSSNGSVIDAMWHGWSSPEPHGSWTIGRRAILYWRAPYRIEAGGRLLIEVPHISPGKAMLRGRILLNSRTELSFGYKSMQANFTIAIPLTSEIAGGQDVELQFEIDNPRPPSRTLKGEDHRTLGLSVRRVWIEPPGTQS